MPSRPPLYLVRHGESTWNVQRLTQGQTAHPDLTDTGRIQALAAGRAVAEDLRALGWDGPVQVRSSDLVRALRTAESVAQVLGAAAPGPDPRLREQALGALEGRSYEETWAEAEQHDWSDDHAPMAGGESVAQVRDRMEQALLDHLDRDVPVVLVSHGDALRHVVRAVGADGQPAWVPVPNGAVLRVLEDAGVWLVGDDEPVQVPVFSRPAPTGARRQVQARRPGDLPAEEATQPAPG